SVCARGEGLCRPCQYLASKGRAGTHRLVADALVEVFERDAVRGVGLGLASLLDFREVVVLRLVEHQDGRLLGSLARRHQAAVDFHLTTDEGRGFGLSPTTKRSRKRSRVYSDNPDRLSPLLCYY